MQVLATLIWLPQAALIAWSIAAVQNGRPFADLVLTAVAFVALGMLRSGLEAAGIRLSFASARAYTQELRLQSLATLAQRSPLDAERRENVTWKVRAPAQLDDLVADIARREGKTLSALIRDAVADYARAHA